MHAVPDLFGCERTNLGRLVKRIADFQAAHSGDEFLQKLVVDLVGDEETFCRDAGLTTVDRARCHRRRDRVFEVGARHHDECVAAAEFEHAFFDVARGDAGHGAAGFLAAGERDRFHARIDNYLFNLFRFDEERLKNAVIKSRATKYLFNGKCALRHI